MCEIVVGIRFLVVQQTFRLLDAYPMVTSRAPARGVDRAVPVPAVQSPDPDWRFSLLSLLSHPLAVMFLEN